MSAMPQAARTAARTATRSTARTTSRDSARQGTTRPTPRSARAPRRPRRPEAVNVPLGSLTQRDQRPDAACRVCGSGHVTRLSMSLTDGTPVDFTSCHHCEHKTWEHAGHEISVDGVLDRTRKLPAPQVQPM